MKPEIEEAIKQLKAERALNPYGPPGPADILMQEVERFHSSKPRPTEEEADEAYDAFEEFKAAWSEFQGYLACPQHSGCYSGAQAAVFSILDNLIEDLEMYLPDPE